MKRHAPSLLLTALLVFTTLPALNAQKRGDPLSNAVDAKGVRRSANYVYDGSGCPATTTRGEADPASLMTELHLTNR